MNIQNELSRAIIAGDMEIVRRVYKYLFGQEAPNAGKNSPNNDELLFKIINLCTKNLTADNASIIEENDVEPQQIIKTEKPSKEKPQTQFISPETDLDNDPKYQEFIKAQNAKPRPQGRKPYKAIMKSCDICGKEFNYSKTYPAGHFGDKIRCDGCQKR